MHHRGIGPDVVFLSLYRESARVFARGMVVIQSAACWISTQTLFTHSFPPPPPPFHCTVIPPTFYLDLQHLLSIRASLSFPTFYCITRVSFRSTNWATIFVKQSAHSPGGLLLRQKGGEGSLLFAGGELADFAGCGDSFTWGVGRGWGSAFGFGLAVQRPPFCPIHTNWLGYSWTVVCVPLILIFFGHLS